MLKKRRNTGSFINGFSCCLTLVEVEMLTTAGMLCSSIGAKEGSGVPSACSGRVAFADKAVRLRRKIASSLVFEIIV